MRFDELIDSRSKPVSSQDMLDLIHDLVQVEDIPDDERSAWSTGVLMGMAYVLGRWNEDRHQGIRGAAQTLIQLQGEWSAHGI